MDDTTDDDTFIKEEGRQDSLIKEEDFADIEIVLNDNNNDINSELNSEESKNTNKATDVSWRIFAHFLEEKYPEINSELITKQELNEILSKFYVEVRKKNGDMYTKSSMNSIRFGIQRKFKQMYSKFDIIEDPEFSSSGEMFKAQCVHLKRQGLDKVEHKPSIKRADLFKLYTSPVLALDQPKSLQRKVFLDVMLYLCKRAQENFRELLRSNFALKTDVHGVEYVEKVGDPQGTIGDDMSDESGIMAATGTKICPIYSFKLYLSRLDPDSEVFFQRPKPFAPPSGPWFHPLMLGKHCFGKMMKGISKDANLSFHYTNHCIRATSVSVLEDAGLDGRHMITAGVGGHILESRPFLRPVEIRPAEIGTKRKLSPNSLLYYNNRHQDERAFGEENDHVNDMFSEAVLQPVSFNQEEVARKKSPPLESTDDSDCEENVEGPAADENEMASLLNSFGADVSKSLSAKRKRFGTFTNASIKTSNKKYDEIFTKQQSERENLIDVYGKQVSSVFSQWETDIHKSQEANEQLENIVRQLQKTLQQQRVVQNQRLTSLKSLHEQYMTTSADLAKMHRDQQINLQSELRKDLVTLQKRMMDDARQDEISNVRKSLQTMLSQV